MAHQFADRVVGGVEQPRFLLVGPELSPNRSFEEGITGVGGTTSNTQAFDTETPFGDYCLQIFDDDTESNGYAEITINTGAAIAGKRFIITAFVRNYADADLAFWCDLPDLTGDFVEQYVCDNSWYQEIVQEVVVPADASGNTLKFRIYPSPYNGAYTWAEKIRIDNFRCREVVQEILLPLPTRGNARERWVDEDQARNQLANGTKKRYRKGVRYFYESSYEKLTAANEILRRTVKNTRYDILFFPHKDSRACYFVEWNEDFESEWSHGVAALGHEGGIVLEGTELLPDVDMNIIDAISEYIAPEDPIFMETLGNEFIIVS